MLVLSPVTGHGREPASPVIVPLPELYEAGANGNRPVEYIAGNQRSESYVKWP
jgi:hypothetical protein